MVNEVIPGLGTRTDSTLFFFPPLNNRAVLPHKTTMKVPAFVLSFDSNDKLHDPIVGNVVRNGSRAFNDIHSRYLAKYLTL